MYGISYSLYLPTLITQQNVLFQNIFLLHLWQKIIGNSKGEGSPKPVISNQLGRCLENYFPKINGANSMK